MNEINICENKIQILKELGNELMLYMKKILGCKKEYKLETLDITHLAKALDSISDNMVNEKKKIYEFNHQINQAVIQLPDNGLEN
jgi:hypothetical protein